MDFALAHYSVPRVSCGTGTEYRGVELIVNYDALRAELVTEPLFVAINPNSKIPALVDYSMPKSTRVFESASILLYLADKFGAFVPDDPSERAECLSWLFWQMGSAPYLGGGFGHFYAYAPYKMEYPSTVSPWR